MVFVADHLVQHGAYKQSARVDGKFLLQFNPMLNISACAGLRF